MDPKPLFPTGKRLPIKVDVTTVEPKPLFLPTPQVIVQVPVVKAMFANKAITANAAEIDPFYKNHPLCASLSNKDISRVRNIVDGADLHDTSYVINYADELRTKFATLVDTILSDTKSGNIMSYDIEITQLLEVIRSTNATIQLVASPPKPKRRWLEGMIPIDIRDPGYTTVKEVIDEFQNKIHLVNTLTNGLVQNVSNLITYVDSLDALFKDNRDNFLTLNLHVVAGRLIVDKNVATIIPAMELALDRSDPFKVQDFVYFKDCVNRFGRKIDDLEQIAHSVILNAPQIRMMQMNSKDTSERIKRISQYVIPAWKTQFLTLINILQKTGTTSLSQAVASSVFQKNKALLDDIITSQKSIHSAFV